MGFCLNELDGGGGAAFKIRLKQRRGKHALRDDRNVRVGGTGRANLRRWTKKYQGNYSEKPAFLEKWSPGQSGNRGARYLNPRMWAIGGNRRGSRKKRGR